ncbi:MAG TPA: hypothetical protein VMP00_06435, partial [Burkholderiales bacterium]|nr:hypothetical protein [Burkholderiales bacterium]
VWIAVRRAEHIDSGITLIGLRPLNVSLRRNKPLCGVLSHPRLLASVSLFTPRDVWIATRRARHIDSGITLIGLRPINLSLRRNQPLRGVFSHPP